MKKDRKIVELLKKSLIENFPGLIDKVIFFGSRVYGKPYKDSDYDILIVLHSDCDWQTETKIRYTCYDIDLDYNIFADISITSNEKLKTIQGREPFIIDAFERGVVI